MRPVFRSSEQNIDNTGATLVTAQLQALIDETAAAGGILILENGTYQTASLFLKSGMEFHMEENTVLLGTTDESQYPIIDTRVAGIEMKWYPGVLNVNDQKDVVISGGTVNGQGEYWWSKYWGDDMQGGMRKEYDARGLRWACDYDCMRVRNVVVMNSSNVTLKDVTSTRSGFWNFHVCYSHDIHIDGVKITSCGTHSPSTDGIDIDSCHDVLIENCVTSCNDDSICIKSGRDGDGVRVGRPCHDITVQNCTILAGFGVTIGSEVSGGVYNVTLKNLSYHGTDCGFRIKSSIARRGYIRDITVDGLEMTNVKYPFHLFLNWNPAYSYCSLPEGYTGEISDSWKALLTPISDDEPMTRVENITIRNVHADNTPDYDGISRAFHIEGFEEQPIRGLHFENVKLRCKEFGVINYTEGIRFENTEISVYSARDAKNDEYDNR